MYRIHDHANDLTKHCVCSNKCGLRVLHSARGSHHRVKTVPRRRLSDRCLLQRLQLPPRPLLQRGRRPVASNFGHHALDASYRFFMCCRRNQHAQLHNTDWLQTRINNNTATRAPLACVPACSSGRHRCPLSPPSRFHRCPLYCYRALFLHFNASTIADIRGALRFTLN